MSEAPFVPFYTSDFLAGTSGMTSSAKGVYITLLCLMYETEAPLPQSWETLARRCGCTLPAFRRAVESLEDDGKVVVTEAGIWSPKCERHIAQRRERHRSATAAAKKRWEKVKENQSPSDKAALNPQCQPEPEPEPCKEEEANASLSPAGDARAFDEIAHAVTAYNAAAEASGWPTVRILSKARRSALAARLREAGGLAGWEAALSKAQASPHCCGENDRGWTANFDFLTRQSSFAKLMEGNYDNRHHHGRHPRADADERIIAFAARAGRTPSSDCF